jgi:hypothetical protein
LRHGGERERETKAATNPNEGDGGRVWESNPPGLTK